MLKFIFSLYIGINLLPLLLKGCIIGFSIAMPLGPIGILCLQHSLMRGLLYGLVAGLGVALADAIYGGLAGLGLNMISSFVVQHRVYLELFGALFLAYLGINILRSRPKIQKVNECEIGLLKVFLTMFTLTLTNPMTILCFAGAFAGIGVCTIEPGLHTSLMLTIGVLVGSLAWWIILTAIVALIGHKIKNLSFYTWFNRISGSFILLFAFLATLHVVFKG